MTIISAPHSFLEDNLYVDLQPIFGQSLFLKCEAFNFPGSIKLKAANAMVEGAEKEGILKPGSALVESSSGNLGLALSMISANKGRATSLAVVLVLDGDEWVALAEEDRVDSLTWVWYSRPRRLATCFNRPSCSSSMTLVNGERSWSLKAVVTSSAIEE